MNWIIKIEEEKNQRVRVEFKPIEKIINFYGEVKLKNNQWTIFSEDSHDIKISLEQIQEEIEIVIIEMRKTLVDYNNINEGFNELKLIAFND